MSKIIPITKATRNIQPPLKKSELVEALAIRELENIKQEQAELLPQIAAAKAAFYSQANLDALLKDGCAEKNGNVPFDEHYAYSSDGGRSTRELNQIYVRVSLAATPEMKRQYRKWQALEKKKINILPSLHQLKQSISDKLSERATAGQRVAALLKNPETSRALDETLAALKKPTQLQLTA